ncbi:transposase [Candidatus Poribacteria bacterium]
MADELELDYGALLNRRHKIQQLALDNKPNETLSDEHTEADEMFQNAGEKGTKHSDPEDPPRRRANKRKGRGFGLRQARYIGLTKTHLQHIFIAAALNIRRMDAWLTEMPFATTRTSRLQALQAIA